MPLFPTGKKVRRQLLNVAALHFSHHFLPKGLESFMQIKSKKVAVDAFDVRFPASKSSARAFFGTSMADEACWFVKERSCS